MKFQTVCLVSLAWLMGPRNQPVRAADPTIEPPRLQEAKQHRKQVAHRQRRILFDNDGNEAVYECEKATAAELLAKRTIGLVGTQVDTIVYCTWSSGFGVFTHHTKVGEIFTCREQGFAKNKTADFIAQGTDPLKIVVEFCRKNRIEVFWSMRMNDTHDAWNAWYSPLMFPKLKKDHPEWLVSTRDRKPRNGAWSAVDYTHPEIRDLAFRYIEEVCQNYDVDGVMLDWFRHPLFFKRHAMGQPVGQQELDMMTDLMRRVRRMADEVGAKRGRPILLATRTPDSVEWSKAIGLDIERWMAEDLIDLLAVSCYFRLNPWEVSVKLGHKYGVPVYPCLSETRLRDAEAAKVRGSLECYRARAMEVWHAGADGIYMFNYHDPKSPLWREIGDPKTLTGLDKVYTTGARGVGVIDTWFAGGRKWLNRQLVSPESPIPLEPGKPTAVALFVGDDLAGAAAQGIGFAVTLRLRLEGLTHPDGVTVEVNGGALAAGTRVQPYTDYVVGPGLLKRGMNRLEVALKAEHPPKVVLQDVILWLRRAAATSGTPRPVARANVLEDERFLPRE